MCIVQCTSLNGIYVLCFAVSTTTFAVKIVIIDFKRHEEVSPIDVSPNICSCTTHRFIFRPPRRLGSNRCTPTMERIQTVDN
jgi:hypothetical protein